MTDDARNGGPRTGPSPRDPRVTGTRTNLSIEDLDSRIREAVFADLEADHPGHDWQAARELARRQNLAEPVEIDIRVDAMPLPPSFPWSSCIASLPEGVLSGYVPVESLPGTAPRAGDVMFVTVERLGRYRDLENKHGRVIQLAEHSNLIGVYGNRYALEVYEGIVPPEHVDVVHLLNRGGIIGMVNETNTNVAGPTELRVLGRVVDGNGRPVSTLDHPMFDHADKEKVFPRAKMILVTGGSMNAGKTQTAAAICRRLTQAGSTVNASRMTGTAKVQDILAMKDSGAKKYNDFTALGYPSTWMLEEDELFRIFDTLDLECANDPETYWIVELADGITQREASLLLAHPGVQERIHKLVLCASDAMGAIGGLNILRDRFGLEPDVFSGRIGSAPLSRRELLDLCQIPIFDSLDPDSPELKHLLVE